MRPATSDALIDFIDGQSMALALPMGLDSRASKDGTGRRDKNLRLEWRCTIIERFN